MGLFGRKKKVVVEEVVEEPTPTLPTPLASNEAGLRDPEEHREYLLGLVEPLNPFGMSLLDAWDQTLCEDIAAHSNSPAYPSAGVIGYAVDAESVAVGETLSLSSAEDFSAGGAVAVSIGDPLPEGADAVVHAAAAKVNGEELVVTRPIRSGDHVRPAGADVSKGDVLVANGSKLTAREIGLLAGVGIDKVLVRPRPRVVILSVGDDLMDVSSGSDDEQNLDSNSYAIAAAARAIGAQVWRVGPIATDSTQLQESITDQLIRADFVIVTPGPADADAAAVRDAMDALGLTDHARLALQPGGETSFGLIGDDEVPMLVLSHDPTEALVGFHGFAVPIVRKLKGVMPYQPLATRAITTQMLRSEPGVTLLIPAHTRLEHGVRTVEKVDQRHALTRLARANALVVVGDEASVIRAGESVMCWLLDPER